jgi:hypothetical protein
MRAVENPCKAPHAYISFGVPISGEFLRGCAADIVRTSKVNSELAYQAIVL